jgi:hypothetical protein
VIFVPVARNSRSIDLFGQIGLVPSAKIQASIGSRDDRVGSVFTTAGQGDDPFDFFELLISIAV